MNFHRSRRFLRDDGVLCEGGVLVNSEGVIVQVITGTEEPATLQCQVHDYGDLVLMAGLVDSHVHLNEPGRTQWEGFRTGTRAAAAGGVTTLADMPLNSLPPTTSVEALETKRSAAQGQCYVDVAFWGGLVPDNADRLLELVAEGVVGFKCFLIDSGVPEFPAVTEAEVKKALQLLRGSECPLAFHAEMDVQHVDIAGANNTEYVTFLSSRPPSMEVKAVQLVARLCEEFLTPCHIVHVSAAEVLEIINKSRSRGAPLSAETCPHYLSLSAESVPLGATQFKCCPPVRNNDNRNELWQGVLNGPLQLVVSDHSPCSPELKMLAAGDFIAAWGGISSLQFGLSIVWSEGKERGLTIAHLARLMSMQPAHLCGLQHRKGKLAVGYDADFVIWDPEEQFQVGEEMIQHRHKLTPYLDRTLFGRVHHTVLRGTTVFSKGTFSETPQGIFLTALHLNKYSNNTEL